MTKTYTAHDEAIVTARTVRAAQESVAKLRQVLRDAKPYLGHSSDCITLYDPTDNDCNCGAQHVIERINLLISSVAEE